MAYRSTASRFTGVLSCALLFIVCGSDGNDTITSPGSGSRSPNAPAFIQGTVTYTDGSVPETGDAEVSLFRIYQAEDDEYEWRRLQSVYTVADGGYRFDSLDAGEYSVFTREDPYLPTGDKLLNGFGGYLTVTDGDSGLIRSDTIVLRENYLVTGRFAGCMSEQIRVSIVGTEYASIISSNPYTDPYFAFGGLPVADFRLKVILNYGESSALSFVAPLPIHPDFTGDTTYTKITYGFTSGVRIRDNSIELITPYFILTCLIEEDRFARTTVAKTADGNGRPRSDIYR